MGRLPLQPLVIDESRMERMQMWLSTGDTSDPIVKVGDDGYWVTRITDWEYLVTRVSDSRRVGTFFMDGAELLRVTCDGCERGTEHLIEEVAFAAKRARFVRWF